MITNEVAFVAIAVSEKERARKWTAHGLSMTLAPSQSVSGAIRRGNHHTMEQQSLLRWKISTPRSTNLKDAVLASILKRLKRLCAGWRNFAIQTETSWSFTNERSNEGDSRILFDHSDFVIPSSFVIRHSSLAIFIMSILVDKN